MGSSISAQLLFIGLDGAGKTCCLTFLEEGPHNIDPKPSKGYDTKEVKFKGITFTVFDVAGSEKLRDLWRHYYEDTNAVIWFIDSANPDRFQESKNVLELAIKDVSIHRNIPILIAANKCDLPAAKSVEEITTALDLENILKGRNWTIMKTNSKTGEGITEALKWLSVETKGEYKKRKHEIKKEKEKEKK